MATKHVPILTREVIELLLGENSCIKATRAPLKYVLDFTLGGGGHTRAMLDHIRLHDLPLVVVGNDQDLRVIDRAQEVFKPEILKGSLILSHQKFGQISSAYLKSLGIDPAHIAATFADLGFSSDQIEDETRGLSFMRDGPLDMRLSPELSPVPLYDKLLAASDHELCEVFRAYGEERFCVSMSRAIKQAQARRTFENSTKYLSDLLVAQLPSWARRGKIHGATRAFQSLRIWVNDEMGELERLLMFQGTELVAGARVGFLSFHETEDRMVKTAFKDKNLWQKCGKKPWVPGRQEITLNPRARSAKLRVATKL